MDAQKTTTAFFRYQDTNRIDSSHGEPGQWRNIWKNEAVAHHLCFRTDDIHADMERLKAKGYRFLSDSPQDGAHGTKVVFIHPKSTDGV